MPVDSPDELIVVAAIVVRDATGRVLTVRKRGTTSYMQPGGKPEAGESAAQAVVREVREEVGLELASVRLLDRWVVAAANEPGRRIDATVFEAEAPVEQLGEPVAAAEIDELRWVDPATPGVDDDETIAPLLRLHVLPTLRAAPSSSRGPDVTVVGIGADGWSGLRPHARDAVLAAATVVGAERQLALLPEVAGQRRAPWPHPFSLDLVTSLPGPLVVLGSGDPLRAGVATALVDRLGADRVEVLPAVSSVALARARMRWSAETTTVLRDHRELPRHLSPTGRVLVLSADAGTPATVAGLLVAAGYGATTMTVLGDLGADTESLRTTTAARWTGGGPPLHVLALELRGPVASSWAPGLPDEAFEHDGQLTKRDLRASALARIAPQPGQLLWDVGAGAGSVGIEWLRADPRTRAVAVEADPERVARIGRNAAALGVPRLQVVAGRAPEVLGDLPDPDAVFVGGGATVPGLLDRCRARLRPGGRLVVHGVTLETEQVLVAAHSEHGGELTRHAVEHAAPLGAFTGWTPARAVVQWSWSTP